MSRLALVLAISITLCAYLILVAGEPRSSGRRERTQSNNHGNISQLLDNLLWGYDNSVRPDFGGPPAVVEVDIMVRSMGPISEVDMTYSMDCYFRQSWVDRRLAFQSGKETLALSISMLARIWKPDTYFYNGKQSYLHTITSPNKFVRLYQDGRVLYSSRLTIKAACPMNLEDFPMDTQRCPLKFGSYGYTTRDVIYKWNSARQVAIAHDMKLSQFDLVGNPTANATDSTLSQTSTVAEYSMLLVSFHLKRHMGNFLIQVYGPCVLLVVLSWVSFWLNREATADRVSRRCPIQRPWTSSFSSPSASSSRRSSSSPWCTTSPSMARASATSARRRRTTGNRVTRKRSWGPARRPRPIGAPRDIHAACPASTRSPRSTGRAGSSSPCSSSPSTSSTGSLTSRAASESITLLDEIAVDWFNSHVGARETMMLPRAF